MPHFQTNQFATPFGNNVFLRSTRGMKTMTRQVASETVPAVSIDGNPGQVILPKGCALATITSGPNTGLVGPFVATVGTAEVQTLTKTGTWSAGTYTLTVLGVTTAPIAYNATAAQIQAAIRLAVGNSTVDYAAEDILVTGGPLSTTAVVVTFSEGVGANVAAITADITLVTGSTPGLGIVETTPGVAGATDGRSTLANLVGLNNTFLPWQLMRRDVEVAVLYECAAVQANCLEMTAAGLYIPLSDTTAAQMFGKKSLDIRFAA